MRTLPVLALAALAAIAPQQKPSITFRSEVNLVEVPVAVLDKQGTFVAGLQKTDFTVFEDGKPREIAAFSFVDAPARPVGASAEAIERPPSDVFTNRPPEGAIYVLLIDDLHIDLANTKAVQVAARRFIEKSLGAGDVAAVVNTRGRSNAMQDFTTDRRLLLAAIDRTVGLASAGEEPKSVFERESGRSGSRGRELAPGDTVHNDRTTLAVLHRISNSLAAMKGRRKALVLFSEGVNAQNGNRDPRTDFDEAVSAALRANVFIYSVDPAGLKLAGGVAEVSGYIPIPTEGSDEVLAGSTSAEANAARRRDGIVQLAYNTGGFPVVNTNKLEAGLNRISEENRRYYLLAFPSDKQDGKFHRLEVKVSVPGVTVRNREGYVAAHAVKVSDEAASDDSAFPEVLREAVDSVLPTAGVRLSAQVAAMKATKAGASATVVLVADGRDLKFEQKEGRFESDLALAIVATDAAGKVRNSVTRTFKLTLRRESYERTIGNGVRIVEQFDLPDDSMRLRIALEDVRSQKAGSLQCALNVADFSRSAFAMSDLLLTSSTAGEVPNLPTDHLNALAARLPAPPTTARTFPRTEVLAFLAEIYDAGQASKAPTVATTISDENGKELYRREEAAITSPGENRAGVYSYTARVPLSAMAPGRYVLRVEAKSAVNDSGTARREIAFEIQEKPPNK